MNELSNDLNYSEMKAELEALRKKLEDLETKQAAYKSGTYPTVRRRFPKRFIIASVSMAALLVAGGLLWGQSAIQALFIDEKGNVRINGAVGINTSPIPNQHLVITPKQDNIPFNVTNPGGGINWLTVDANGKVIMNGGNVSIAKGLSVGDNANFSGNVGIGTLEPLTGVKLDLAGETREKNGQAIVASPTCKEATWTDGTLYNACGVPKGLYVTGNFGQDNSGVEFRHSNQSQGIGFGYNTIYATGYNPNQPLNLMPRGRSGVGIGTNDPKAKLEVAGDVLLDGFQGGYAFLTKNAYLVANDQWQIKDKTKKAAAIALLDSGEIHFLSTQTPGATDWQEIGINGEKAPEKAAMVLKVGNVNDTTHWNHAEADIGPLCGDFDGCTVKFILRENSANRSRIYTEKIYIEQPDNKNPGLLEHYFVTFLGPDGGQDETFRLGTLWKGEVSYHPWDWIYVRNYQTSLVGPESPAYPGYKVQFMTRPNVSATVIIYDR